MRAGQGPGGGTGTACLRVATACDGPMAVRAPRKGSGAVARGAAGARLRGGRCMLLLCPKIFSACGGPQHKTPAAQCGLWFPVWRRLLLLSFRRHPKKTLTSVALSPCWACALVHCPAPVGMCTAGCSCCAKHTCGVLNELAVSCCADRGRAPGSALRVHSQGTRGALCCRYRLRRSLRRPKSRVLSVEAYLPAPFSYD